jgi:TonB family protein
MRALRFSSSSAEILFLCSCVLRRVGVPQLYPQERIMTAASPGPGPNIFPMMSGEHDDLYRARPESFLLSMLGQAAIMGLLIYFTSCVIQRQPELVKRIPNLNELPLIFSGQNGGGGGNHDPLPAAHGNIPKASLDTQLAPPTVILAKEPPKLAVPETVTVAPDVVLPQGGQIGDPMSKFSLLSNGPGGPGGIGSGCCDGIGPSTGPGVGPGPPGIYPAGKLGVTVPQAIFSPEPSFSDEARKAKAQGIVLLLLVVGKDGHTYDIRVRQSLGMGLDEKAIDAVKNWRFRPGTLNGQPVATQIGVQVDFHLY